MSKIVLPKTTPEGIPYLSYSQINTWKKSKREYIRQYFLGEIFTGSDYTEFGSKIGKALEENDFSEFNDKEQKLLKTIPRYDEFEKEICLKLNGFIVKGYIDTNTTDLSKIADYKTGNVETKVNDYASDNYTQLDIYSAAIQQETGKLPEDVRVILIDRKGNAFKGEELTLGEEFVTIIKKVDDKRIKQVIKDVEKVAKEISEYYQLFLKLNGLM